jgi:hypothetical protein
MSKPHDPEFLTKNNVFNRLAVASVWPYPRAPHARDRRRLRIRDGWEFRQTSATTVWFKASDDPWSEGVVETSKDARWHAIAWHADKSFTQHTTLLEAHDALVESGSPSPFEVVTGSAVEAPQTHA